MNTDRCDRCDSIADEVIPLAVLLQPLVWLGVGRRYPWALFGMESAAGVILGVIALALLFGGRALARWIIVSPARQVTLLRASMGLVLATPVLTLALDFVAWKHFEHFGYQRPLAMIPLEAAVFVALLVWLRRRTPGAGVAIAAVGAALHRGLAIVLFPIDERRSNMLTVIMQQIGVWRSGRSPYEGPDPMPYLPGTWLPHWPAYALEIDLRWPGTLILLAIGLWAASALRRRGLRSAPLAHLQVEILAILVLLNPYHALRHELYFDIFFLWTCAVFFLAPRPGGDVRRLVAIAVLVGVAVATRQWAWIYGPFVLLAAASTDRARPRAILGQLTIASLISGAAVLAIVAQAALMNVPAFVRMLHPFAGVAYSEFCLGVLRLAVACGFDRLLTPAQLVLCVASFLLALRASLRGESGPAAIVARGWLVWMGVLLLAPFAEGYFFLSGGFAAAAFGIARVSQVDQAGAPAADAGPSEGKMP